MKRLVYSPRTEVFVKADSGIYDISPYVTEVSVNRKVNQVSSARVVFRNPNMQFTEFKGSDSGVGPVFHPMDPIIISMTRIRNRPIQVFTGYCDTTPYLQLFPGPCVIEASCTLKRLQYTYWDPGLPFVWEFLAQNGWGVTENGIVNFDAETGGLRQGNDTNKSNPITDQGFGGLLLAVLTEIGGWNENNVFIEELPQGIVDLVTGLFEMFKQDSEEANAEFKALIARIVGEGGDLGGATGGAGTGGTGGVAGDLQQYNHIYERDGGETIPFNAAAKIAESVGLPGVTFAQIAIGESALAPGAVSDDGGYGLWQMTPRVQSAETVAKWNALGSYFNPITNAKQAMVLLGGHYSVEAAQRNWFGTSHVTDWNAHYTGS